MATPPTIFERLRKMETRSGQSLNALIAEAAAIGDELLALVVRYRTETPLGHQPHMIAHQADAAIARANAPKPNGNNHRRSA
jgi:hypothetical protein